MFTNNPLEIDGLPQLESIEFESVETSYFKIILLNLVLSYALFFIAFLGIGFRYKDVLFKSTWFWIGLGILFLFFIIQVVVYKLGFPLRQYALRDKDITFKKGLLFHKQTTLPLNRIQHVEVQRSFLAKQMGLATLKIYSAGESGNDLAIKGLSEITASKINGFLIEILNNRERL